MPKPEMVHNEKCGCLTMDHNGYHAHFDMAIAGWYFGVYVDDKLVYTRGGYKSLPAVEGGARAAMSDSAFIAACAGRMRYDVFAA